MKCSACKAENPDGKSFCGDCGATLNAETDRINRQIDQILTERFKDRALVEYDIADKVVSRFETWLKVARWTFAGAAVVFAAAAASLGFLGWNTYSGWKSSIDGASKAAVVRINEQRDAQVSSLNGIASARESQLNTQAQGLSKILSSSGNPAQIQAQLREFQKRTMSVNLQLANQEAAAKENEQKLNRLRNIQESNPTMRLAQIDKSFLEAASAQPFVLLTFGSTGGDVTKLQDKLKDLGCYRGIPSGSFDEATETAVQLFNKTMANPLRGLLPESPYQGHFLVDKTTWDNIFSPLAPALLQENCGGLVKN